jgi:hypothetical protein
MLYIVFLAEISHFVRDDKAFRCFPNAIPNGAHRIHRVILGGAHRTHRVILGGAHRIPRVILSGVRSTK